MRFLLGFLSATIFIAIMIIGCWLYFDFPISTNDDEEQNTPVETSTKSLEQNNTQEQPTQQNNTQQPTKQKHNGITPPNMKEKSPNEVEESQQRKSEIQALQENDKAQEWKKEYNEINEGTDENPYVTINGRKVDPKHVTGKEDNYDN